MNELDIFAPRGHMVSFSLGQLSNAKVSVNTFIFAPTKKAENGLKKHSFLNLEPQYKCIKMMRVLKKCSAMIYECCVHENALQLNKTIQMTEPT